MRYRIFDTMPFHPITLQRLQSQHQMLDELLKGSAAALDIAPAPNKWSVRQHVAHLGRYQEVFQHRLKRILEEHQPQLAQYHSETDNGFVAWEEASIGDILQRLHIQRDLMIRQLNGLSLSDQGRKGVHPKYGPLDVPAWTEFFVLHEAHHLLAIFKLSHQLSA